MIRILLVDKGCGSVEVGSAKQKGYQNLCNNITLAVKATYGIDIYLGYTFGDPNALLAPNYAIDTTNLTWEGIERMVYSYIELNTTKTSSENQAKPEEKIVAKIDEIFDEKNNGGATDYYALPRPTFDQLKTLLKDYTPREEIQEELAKTILSLFPDTLNDLIEYKNMPFWRGEIFKAVYGLEGRMAKNKDPEKAEIRELNKIIYYANRRLRQIEREKNVQ